MSFMLNKLLELLYSVLIKRNTVKHTFASMFIVCMCVYVYSGSQVSGLTYNISYGRDDAF